MLIAETNPAVMDLVFAGRKAALVVEDDALIAAYLSDILEELGFQAFMTATAERALDLVQQQAFSVAFVDLGLPDRSGLELLAELHTLCAELPTIIATAYGEMAHRDMKESGRQLSVLNKPYSKAQIRRMLIDLGFYQQP
jgi:CheY-like chemotaxis protein